MFDFSGKLATCIVTACLFYVATFKSLGALQQLGYRNKSFLAWLKRKENLYFNRLTIWSVLSFLVGALLSVGVSLLGKEVSLIAFVSSCFLFSILFWIADKKHALKVPIKVTNRLQRLAISYIFVTAIAVYLLLCALGEVEQLVGSEIYSLFAISPLAFAPTLTPMFLMIGNSLLSTFEKINNKRLIEKAKRTLERSKAVRIGVVGSYGKTSVKNVLASILSSRYSVVATPESYNTPIGIAKTVNSLALQNVEIFIAEMGARKVGDITELCELVKPDYAIFTGVCRQHMATFEREENVLKAKCEIIKGAKNTIICGAELKAKISTCPTLTGEERAKCVYLDKQQILDLELNATSTEFSLTVGQESIKAHTTLLGEGNAENIALAILLAYELGMTKEEIELGLKNVEPIPHRLELIQANGVYILDDAYNCSERSAKESVKALKRFHGKHFIVTPGIIEGGAQEKELNENLGKLLAESGIERIMLVKSGVSRSIKKGYFDAGGDEGKIVEYCSLEVVKDVLKSELQTGDAVLFMNDLPDVC